MLDKAINNALIMTKFVFPTAIKYALMEIEMKAKNNP